MPKMMLRSGQGPGLALLASPLQVGNTEDLASVQSRVSGKEVPGPRPWLRLSPTESMDLIFRSLMSTYAFKGGMASVVEPHCQPHCQPRTLTHVPTP